MKPPPTRLLEDSALSDELRADLRIVAQHPHQVDLGRAAGALAAAIGSSAISATGHASSSAAPAASASSTLSALPLALKATLAAVGGVAVIGLGVVQLQSRPHETPPARPAASAPARPTTPQPPAAAAPAASEAAPEPPAVSSPAPLGPSASRREIAQLRRIQRLLAHDPAAAQHLAEASQREFPHGALREEREGLSVLALFKLGDRARALPKARRFLDQHPQSPLAERIRQLVADEPSP